MVRSSRAALRTATQNLDLVEAQTAAGDPHRIVSRGFAVVRLAGRVVTDADALDPGAEIQIGFRDGAADAVVKRVEAGGAWQDGGDTGPNG